MLRFEGETLEGKLIRRYKRFLADVELPGGKTVTIHCPNSGSMAGCKEPGSAVLISKSPNPNRKLAYTWELVKIGRTWVCVNTGIPNRLVYEAICNGEIPELKGYEEARREVPYGKNSRIDVFLEGKRGRCYVEVKNVTLLGEKKMAEFPDAVTERGQKHLREMMQVVRKGDRAVAFFLVNRSDCEKMGPADSVDPEYGRLLREAAKVGVELLAYQARSTKEGVAITRRVPVIL